MRSTPRPRPEGGASAIAPLFPLPNVFLFPGCVMPLHVFEPRYRLMIEEQLDGPGRIVVGTVPDEHADDLPASPPVRAVAGLGEICRHERLPDGRFLIWLFGLGRVRVSEVGSDGPYRRVAIEPLCEIKPSPARAAPLASRLREAVRERGADVCKLPKDIPLSCLADLLLQRLQLPSATMARLFAELDVEKRALGALEEHARRLLSDPPPSAEPSP